MSKTCIAVVACTILVVSDSALAEMRIGGSGPVFSEGVDSRTQTQDSYAGVLDTSIQPGEHHVPSQSATSRFDTVPLSCGVDVGGLTTPRVVTGDSITIRAEDAGGGTLTSINFYGAIVEGPHTGKAPPDHMIGPHGFFVIAGIPVRVGTPSVVVEDLYFVDIEDDYLLGGDRLVYFWGAESDGVFASNPSGLTAIPASIEEAELATKGLHEMSALPAIVWSQDFLDRIALDEHGDVKPTNQEISDSSQRNCILYYNQFDSRRRSGDLNRTHFMYTLDVLGYRDKYDVYDVSGYGNTNNQLFSRATVNQLGGYELIVHDTGSSRTLTMTDGTSLEFEKIDMQINYANWLSQAPTLHGVDRATLWALGENLMESGHPQNTFWGLELGVNLASTDQGDPVVGSSPDVVGKTSNNWNPAGSTDWTGGLVGAARLFTLDGGLPDPRDYDGLGSSGSVLTHVYRVDGVEGQGAISIYKRPDALSNAIVSSFGWLDIRPFGSFGWETPTVDLLSAVLEAVVSETCLEPLDFTGISPGHELDGPRVTLLRQNVPNPFNPATTIHFDLARSGQVKLRIFDVAGHLVRTLVDMNMEAGRNYQATWNGLDQAGSRVPSGLYFYQLEAMDFTDTMKMVVLK